jgi:inosine-uridine nucleoside N-ribohydrolase
VLALTHPEIFVSESRHVRIETRGEFTRGMTVIDQRRITERADPNCEVLVHVEDAIAFDLLIDAIAHFSR